MHLRLDLTKRCAYAYSLDYHLKPTSILVHAFHSRHSSNITQAVEEKLQIELVIKTVVAPSWIVTPRRLA